MKKYALCIGFGVVLSLSCVDSAMAQTSFQAWKTHLKNSFEQVGRSIKQEASLLGGELGNVAAGVQNQIINKTNNGINTVRNKATNAAHTLNAKRSGFFNKVTNGVANFADRLSASVNN